MKSEFVKLTLTVPTDLREWLESEADKNFQSISGFTAATLSQAKERRAKDGKVRRKR